MCEGCYEEYGRPLVKCGSTDKVVSLIAAIYENSCVGGGMHIQLDDWNIEDDHFDAECEGFLETDTERQCFALMKAMSLDERATALAMYDGYITQSQ